MRAKEEEARVMAEMIANGIDIFPARFNDKGERVCGHTPEERLQILREQRGEEEKLKPEGSISALADDLKRDARGGNGEVRARAAPERGHGGEIGTKTTATTARKWCSTVCASLGSSSRRCPST